MKWLLSSILLVVAFAIITDAQNSTAVTPTNKPKCSDYLEQSICDRFLRLINRLHESSNTLQKAIEGAIAAHKNSTKDLTNYIKIFIAENIQCEKVLSNDTCIILGAVSKRLKLTSLQVKMAIEKAVEMAKSTTKDLRENVIEILTGEISCEDMIGNKTCQNIEQAITKFHEQRKLLKEAIMSAVMHHINNTKDITKYVKNYILDKVVNFNCSDYLKSSTCDRLNRIAKRLKLLPLQVKRAIETAIINGAGTALAVYQQAIKILTTQITCSNILSPQACNNLVEATKKLHEQRILIQEALMEAARKQITDAKDIYIEVKNKLVQAAINFKCTYVLKEGQCEFLKRVAQKFHLRTTELKRILVETVVNGTSSAKAIYDATIGALIRDAKALKCEDLIDPIVCAALDNFADRLSVSHEMVTEAVKRAITKGKSKIDDIRDFVKNLIVDEKTCYDVLKSNVICQSLKFAAWIKGITFDRVIERIRQLYVNGVTKVSVLINKIKDFLKESDTIAKRDVEDEYALSVKDELIDLVFTIIGGIKKVGAKVKENIKEELKKMYDTGKLRLTNLKETVKKLLEKYTKISNNEQMDEDITTDLSNKLNMWKEKMKEYANQLMKMLQHALKNFPKGRSVEAIKKLKELEVLVQQSVDDEFDAAIRGFL